MKTYSLAEWKKLCVLYYKGNPLLFEYFGAKEEYESVKSSNKSQDNLAKYIPNQINVEDGIRLFASYHPKSSEYGSFQRKIINPDIIKFQNGEFINVLEYDIVEIEKYLKKAGEKMDYPADINFLKPFDFYTNYPTILHGSEKTDRLLQTTVEAFKTIFEIQNKTLNKTISFTLAWEMENFEARLSIFGKSSEIVKWLNEAESIPVDYGNFRKWIIQQKNWIYDNYNYLEKDFSDILKSDGIFHIKRKPIDHDMISFPNDEDESYFEIKVKANTELDKFIKEKTIFPSRLGIIKKATCTKTGSDYFTSETSKYLDNDVKMAIERIELAGFFWTDEEYH